jgi:hypothetical protein
MLTGDCVRKDTVSTLTLGVAPLMLGSSAAFFAPACVFLPARGFSFAMKTTSIIKALVFVAGCAPALGAASAQSISQNGWAAFEQMKRAPLDYETTYTYVDAAVAARDYEGAIAALERLLTYNPQLSRAEYELGVLYFRLRSYEQAVIHFEQALNDPSLDPALGRRIEGFLPEARKQLQRSRFTGVFQLVYRYNSNVAGVPGSSIMRSFGFDVPMIRPYNGKGDSSVFLLGDVSHVYDFENGRGDQWETRASGYLSRNFNVTSLDVALGDVNTGPRLALGLDSLPGWTVRPFAAAGGTLLGGNRFMTSAGGGLSLGIPVTPFVSLDAAFEGRSISVANPYGAFGALPNQSTLSSGALWLGSLAANWSVSDTITFSGRAFYGYNAASGGGVSSNQYGLAASLKVEYAAPVEWIGMNWSVTPFIRLVAVDFARPDFTVDPWITRRDRQFVGGLQFDMPVTSMVGVSATAQYVHYGSNIQNYDATSWSFLIGPTVRF